MEALARLVAGMADVRLETGDAGVFAVSPMPGAGRFNMFYHVQNSKAHLHHDGITLARVPFNGGEDTNVLCVIARFFADMIALWCARDMRPCTTKDELLVNEHLGSYQAFVCATTNPVMSGETGDLLHLREVFSMDTTTSRKTGDTLFPRGVPQVQSASFANLRCPKAYDQPRTAALFWRVVDACCSLLTRSPGQPLG